MTGELKLAADPTRAAEQLAVLASGGSEPTDEPEMIIPEEVYSGEVREFVYDVVGDLVELKRETNLSRGPMELPVGWFLVALQEEYDLEAGSNVMVIEQLLRATSDLEVSPIDHFIASVFEFPFAFRHSSEREAFDENLRAGRETAAARQLVQKTYDVFEMPEPEFEEAMQRGGPV